MSICCDLCLQVYFAGLGCLKNVRAALCRGRALKCTRCGRPGATIGCRVDRCPRTYHLVSNLFYATEGKLSELANAYENLCVIYMYAYMTCIIFSFTYGFQFKALYFAALCTSQWLHL